MDTVTSTSTVGQVCAMQTVVPGWMSAMRDTFGPDQPVVVDRKVTPFGTFVVGMTPVTDEAPDAWLDDMGE